MVQHNNGPIIRSNFPRAGSLSGTQKRSEFITDLLSILGDTRLLWLPLTTETTTSIDESRNARTLTYSKDITTWDTPGPVPLGSGSFLTFDGVDEEADTPDVDGLSFGDGVADEPFSIVALINPTDSTNSAILSKRNSSSVREWLFWVNGEDQLEFTLYDESSNGIIARDYSTTVPEGAWALGVATYDGSASVTGINLYLDAAKVDDTDNSSGVYTATENTAALVRLGFMDTTPAVLFDGSMALVALVAKALGQDEIWAVKAAINAYFALSL